MTLYIKGPPQLYRSLKVYFEFIGKISLFGIRVWHGSRRAGVDWVNVGCLVPNLWLQPRCSNPFPDSAVANSLKLDCSWYTACLTVSPSCSFLSLPLLSPVTLKSALSIMFLGIIRLQTRINWSNGKLSDRNHGDFFCKNFKSYHDQGIQNGFQDKELHFFFRILSLEWKSTNHNIKACGKKLIASKCSEILCVKSLELQSHFSQFALKSSDESNDFVPANCVINEKLIQSTNS